MPFPHDIPNFNTPLEVSFFPLVIYHDGVDQYFENTIGKSQRSASSDPTGLCKFLEEKRQVSPGWDMTGWCKICHLYIV